MVACLGRRKVVLWVDYIISIKLKSNTMKIYIPRWLSRRSGRGLTARATRRLASRKANWLLTRTTEETLTTKKTLTKSNLDGCRDGLELG
jgi:hypothetical protein